ncbi:type II toxin-antitoxin system RelE/ParE family toxin [Cuspidothrix issatschenkoi]|uniref:type II toxin-antitoxin system RelE/ParE family toxin n=1 Tax=Cuspidothrix issatschenkoi TaxID=230752 RepID=UPI001D1438C6|nr:type II toxin-antitoxin system mRNA interferase toxin, RelE/StbE family [Cuspidothrix issatschenkoi]
MRELVLTPKFKRAFRKFVKRDPQLETKIIQTLELMQEDVFASQLSTHSLKGKLLGLKACSCGYDCRILGSTVLVMLNYQSERGNRKDQGTG